MTLASSFTYDDIAWRDNEIRRLSLLNAELVVALEAIIKLNPITGRLEQPQTTVARAALTAAAEVGEVGGIAAAMMAEIERLRSAVKAVYFVAHWSADRPCDEISLWTELRDAAGIEPGASTAALAKVKEGK